MKYMEEADERRYIALHNSYFGGPDDGVVEFQRIRIVKTRVPHRCASDGEGHEHEIPTGSLAVADTAKYDGKVGTSYDCLGCLDKWGKEIGC